MRRFFDRLTIECPVTHTPCTVSIRTFHDDEHPDHILFTDLFRGCENANGLPVCSNCMAYVNANLLDDPSAALRDPLRPPLLPAD